MSDTISVKYSGAEITYDENKNKWVFELNGNERKAESLANAKAAIDKPRPKEKKAFEPIPVYFSNFSEYKEAHITSIADNSDYRGGNYCWIVCGRERSKESASRLFARNEKNAKIIAEIKAHEKDLETIRKRSDKLVEQLELAALPEREEQP